jgi:DNA-binding MarR family transcriptional regulator
MKPHGLTHVQFELLASLAWLDVDRPVTQKQLADHAATDVMMTSQVLRALEDRGLVRRAAHPDDRRARALTVTDAGRELANNAATIVEACDHTLFDVLGPDAAVLAQLLRRGSPPAAGLTPAGHR